MPSKTYTPSNSKILIETSVLVAASVRVLLPEGEVTDHFYYPSIELFAYIRKNLPSTLGIITQTIEREAYNALSSAIVSTIERNVPDKSKHYEYKSIALNKCEENMRRLTNMLLREPCDEDGLLKINDEVHSMYKALEARAKTIGQIQGEAHRNLGGAQSGGMVNAIYASRIAVLNQENAQLLRLKKVHASPKDVKLLAEAIHIKRRYDKSSRPKYHFLMASTDSNNFVPAPSEFGPSRAVTDEIFNKYGIDCDRPEEIQKKFI